mgnify:CR=1 FL=1
MAHQSAPAVTLSPVPADESAAVKPLPPPDLKPRELAMRSLLPLVALGLLLLVPAVSAYGLAILTLVWWQLQRRFA